MSLEGDEFVVAVAQLDYARKSQETNRIVAALKIFRDNPSYVQALADGALPETFAELCDLYAQQSEYAQALKAARKASELFKQELNAKKSKSVLLQFARATHRNARSLGSADATTDEFKDPALKLARLALFLVRKFVQSGPELKEVLVTVIERLEAMGEFIEASEYYTELELVDPPIIPSIPKQ